MVATLPDIDFEHYPDSGCQASPSCLSCPLPVCKHDDPYALQRSITAALDLKVWQAVKQDGLSIEDAMERFQVTERTVYRKLARCQEAKES